MKVLMINNCHFNRGGADVVYLNTGKLLENNGFEVAYFSIKNPKNLKNNYGKYFAKHIDFFEKNTLKKIMSIPRFIYSIDTKNKLNVLVNKFKPDVAHIHLYKGGLTSSILGELKKMKIPVVITLHDYGLLDPHNLLINGKLQISNKTINGSAFHSVLDRHNRNSYIFSMISYIEYSFHRIIFPFEKYFTKIIAVSRFSQKLHGSSKKINSEIQHLYNFSPFLKEDFKNIIYKEKYLLFFGRLAKEKGVSTLVKAIEKLNKKIKVFIVGTGILETELKSYANKKGLSNIEFLGHKSGNELYKLIKEAYFTVVPSEWYENNPMTIIESYSLGVPVIGSKVGGIPELVVGNKTGYIFNMGDAQDLKNIIEKALILDENEYFRMKNYCLEFARKKFSKENHLKELTKIYYSAINEFQQKSI